MVGRGLSAYRRRGQLVLLPVLLLVVSLAMACSSGHKQNNATPFAVSSTAGAGITGAATGTGVPPTRAAAPVPTATPDDSPLAQFMMPKYNVTGKIVVKGVDPATNVMQSPDNKDDVAYYDFTPRPGFGCESSGKCGNTVLSGHVDWYTGQVGVFWHLKDLKEGDELDLKLADGKLYKYKIVSNTVYKLEAAPVEEIIGDTPQESLTVITCDGVFNKSLQEYNSRRVVRAVRES